MSFTEDDLQPLSGLQHLAFCERQWGLIHLEGLWAENRLTVEGSHLHERSDAGGTEVREGVRTARGVMLRSLRLGLSGKADVVEFHPLPRDEPGVTIPGVSGRWRAVPVEYKRGRPKRDRCDEVQLCAQALCLEEMLGGPVAEGALFYAQTRRRLPVAFDDALRAETEALAARLHERVRLGVTPPAVLGPACANCSLNAACLPRVTGGAKSARGYLSRAIARCLAPDVEDDDEAPA